MRAVKIYCETNARTKNVRVLQQEKRVELVYSPYDEGSTTEKISPTAALSDAQWKDLNVGSWDDLAHVPSWGDFEGSEQLPAIRKVVGLDDARRRDCLHVDSAHKTGCRAFITTDGDILGHREELEALLGIRFFHPERDAAALEAFVDETTARLTNG